MLYREYGNSGLTVSALAFGGWPIAGVRWSNVNERDSVASIRKALDVGINFIDTAYMYGEKGESEILVGKAIAGRRDEAIIATKCGVHLQDGRIFRDSSPERIRNQVEASLQRLNTDVIDLYQIHAPDENTPLDETAEVMVALLNEGKIRAIGVSNYDIGQMRTFSQVAPLHSLQPRYSMIDRRIETKIIPYCLEQNIGICVYCPLERGLLTDRIRPAREYPSHDDRHHHTAFRGEAFKRTKAINQALQRIARECHTSLAQLVINWTIHQPGITVAIVGATRPHQVIENAKALDFDLSKEQMQRINALIDTPDR